MQLHKARGDIKDIIQIWLILMEDRESLSGHVPGGFRVRTSDLSIDQKVVSLLMGPTVYTTVALVYYT